MAAESSLLSIQNWESSLERDFSISRPAHATLSTQPNQFRIFMQATEPETLRLVCQKPLHISGNFVLEMDLKLQQIGRDDDGTGPNAKLEIEFATGAPLNRRFRIQLIRDRYKVEPQFKIFRTDENWHHWRFEVRVDEGTIRLTRDERYECAHKIPGAGVSLTGHRTDDPNEPDPKIVADTSQTSRFELLVFSNSNTPVEIEIGKIRLADLVEPAKPERVLAPRLVHEILPGEWPGFRRDRSHSAHSPLSGQLKNPKIQWTYELGGSTGSEFLDDINGDGKPELVIGIPGRLSAYRLDGTQIWAIPVENATIYGMFDLDGDGHRELVITNGGKIQVLAGETGKVRFTNLFDAKYGVSSARIARLNPDQPGQQIVVCNQHQRGYCLSFENGIENGRVAWTYDYKMANFVPGIAFADMDNDGRLELIAVTYSNFFVYDGVTGAIKMHLEAHVGRNYGLLVVQDLDQDGFPDIVMFSSRVREHIAVVKNETGDSLRLLWDKFFEQNYPTDHRELRLFNHAVDDFDGDGRIELLYGLWDETGTPNWTTCLVDALTGEVKHALKDTYPINVAQFWANRPPQVLVSEIFQPQQRTETNDTRIKIIDFSKGTIPLAELPQRRLLTSGSVRDYAPNVMREFEKSTSILVSKNFSTGAFFQVLDQEQRLTGLEFISGQPNGALTSSWSAILPGQSAANDTLIAFYPDALEEPALLLAQNDNQFRLFTDKGRQLGQFPCGGVTGDPLTGDLAGDGGLRILVQDSQNQLLCLKPRAGKKAPQREWAVPVSGNAFDWQKNQGQKSPLIVDLDRDGKKEILVAQDPAQLTLLNRHGEVKDQFTLPAAPGYFTFGQFTGRNQWDLYVAYGEIVSLQSQVIRTDTAHSVAWNMACGNGNPAVFSFSSDHEDLILRDLVEHRTLNGRTGHDLFAITQWFGYHIPTIVTPENGAPFLVWTGGVYSITAENLNGEQLWWRPFSSGWKPAGIADVDGDGRVEIGSATFGQLYNWPQFYPVDGPDGQFICLDALTGETKWEFPLKTGISAVITADVDGDGNPEFIFGTTDGHLIALRGGEASRRVAFDIQLPAAVGAPIICDLFGRGKMQILVGCGDGKLYCIQ